MCIRDREDSEIGMCGMLKKSMYGTRDAAQNWECAYAEFMLSIGFKRGIATPCAFLHEGRDVRVVVHGDDFTVLGYGKDLDWFRGMIQGTFEVKFRGRIGPADEDQKSIRVLNRVIEWTQEGIQLEPDQRHAEIIIRDLGLVQSKPVSTPGVPMHDRQVEADDDEKLGPREATQHRAMVARANYLAQDRTDIQYTVKELSRKFAEPCKADHKALKRLGRYLIGRERVRTLYRWQSAVKEVTCYVDTDYAGCVRTRKSTSAGVLMIGTHVVKAWSVTQAVVALSSGEAEYYGLVRGGSVALGLRSVLSDLGMDMSVCIKSDASAAIGIASRRGLGKVRHIEVNQLWLQEKVANKVITVVKIKGTENPADALTKYLNSEKLLWHMKVVSSAVCQDRHALMPSLG